MRKPQPLELELSMPDKDFLQDRIDALFVEIVKYNLEHSNATHKEKVSYIDNVIKALNSE